jgi:glycosyltransferase involved in cell wall biosynthesis
VSWRYLPDGPWVVPFALPSLLADGHTGWRDFFYGSAHVVACTDFCQDVLIANGMSQHRVTVLRQALPGADRIRRLNLPPDRPAESTPCYRLGFFGRFTPVKGPDLLLEAMRQLRAEGVDVVAQLAGPISDADGEWAERLLRYASGPARYLGVKQGASLANWLTTLDLVVLPSRWLETGPLTLLEAWDRGVPVIGTNLGGIRDFLTAAGLPELLFNVNDPPAIAAAVRRVLAWRRPAPEVRVPGVDGLARRMTQIYERCLAAAT